MDKIENEETTEGTFSRRKALSRIGLFAAVAYTVPAFTTLSMAKASDGSSGSSEASDTSSSSSTSSSSGISSSSSTSSTSSKSSSSGPSSPSPSDVLETCGDKVDYEQCLIENDWVGYVPLEV